MKKILLILVAIVVVFIVGLLLLVDSAAKAAVEQGGTYALGVETKLDEASIGLFSGEFSLGGLSVANPEGFDGEHFLELSHGGLALDMGSLNSDVIDVPEIELSGVVLDVDRNSSGTNYGKILENLERVSGGGEGSGEEPTTPDEGGEEAAGKELHIGRIVIRDVTAKVKVLPVGGEASRVNVTIPELVIEEPAQLTVAETYSLVMETLMSAVVQHGAGIVPEDVLKDLGSELEDLRGEVLSELEGIKEAGKGLEEAGKKLEEGLKGLLGND